MQTVKNVFIMFLVSLLTAGGVALYVKDLIMGDVEKSFSSVYSFQSKIKNDLTTSSEGLTESISGLKSYLDGAVSLNENNIIQTRSDLNDSIAFIGKRADSITDSVSNFQSTITTDLEFLSIALSGVNGTVATQDEVISEIRELLADLPTTKVVEPEPLAVPVAPVPPALPTKKEMVEVAKSCPDPLDINKAKTALRKGIVFSRPGEYVVGYSYDITPSGNADNVDIKGKVSPQLRSSVRRYVGLLEWDSGTRYNNCEDSLKVVIN